MLRIWKGIEKEGKTTGIPPMFICSNQLIFEEEILQILQAYPEIKRLYFGAGRVPFRGIVRHEKLWKYCATHNISVAIEINICSRLYRTHTFLQYFDTFVTFILTDYVAGYRAANIVFKTDDFKEVKMYESASFTSLETLLDNNLYSDDVLLFER